MLLHPAWKSIRYWPPPCAVFRMLKYAWTSPSSTLPLSVVINASVELRIFQWEFCVTQERARPHFTSQSSPRVQRIGVLAISASIAFCCWVAHPVRKKASASAAAWRGFMPVELANWRTTDNWWTGTVGGRYLIQCKRFAPDSLVGSPTVREFYGGLIADRRQQKESWSRLLDIPHRQRSSLKLFPSS